MPSRYPGYRSVSTAFLQLIFASAFAVGAVNAEVASPLIESSTPGLQHRLARWLRPSIADDEDAVLDLKHRLDGLPPLTPGRRGASAGYHSRYFESATEPLEIVLDLGQSQNLDRVAIFSVSAVFRGEMIAGYGFPAKFRVDVADDESFSEPTTLLEYDAQDQSYRPEYPVQVVRQKVSARYVRVRVLRHWRRDDGRYLTVFGELMILSGGRNVAAHAKVNAESFTSLPDWSLENLVDGQTDLGLPISPEPSTGNGFLSKARRHPDFKKWVQVELPAAMEIDEVRLIPAEPFDAPSQRGHGFPTRFKVVASATADFSSPHIIADHTWLAFPNPGDNPVVFPTEQVNAKFIRMEVEELWHISHGIFAFALAELQVYRQGKNIAPGAEVTASDVLEKLPAARVWKPEFLVDGSASQNRLIELDDWLDGLRQRAATEDEIARLVAQIDDKVERTTNALLLVSTVLTAGLAAFVLLAKRRRKQALARQREEMRTRIARDLHDDLGSRLGGMRLISETMLADSQLPDAMREDLGMIHQASGEATAAIRDIVWLLDTKEVSRLKLGAHMRQIVPSILGRIDYEFHVREVPDHEFDFDRRRQILFAFKECLGNVAKHASADFVSCRLEGNETQFAFEVVDNGVGFDSNCNPGDDSHGLENLRFRAALLGGSVSVSSSPGKGTSVRFVVPLR